MTAPSKTEEKGRKTPSKSRPFCKETTGLTLRIKYESLRELEASCGSHSPNAFAVLLLEEKLQERKQRKEEMRHLEYIDKLHRSLAFAFFKIIIQLQRSIDHPQTPLTQAQVHQQAQARMTTLISGLVKNRGTP